MDSVSRPLIALLLGTVAVFAVWLVALKPSSSTGGAGASGPGVYASAIAKAHAAVATSAAASVAHGGTVVTAAPTPPAAAGTPRPVASTATQPVLGTHSGAGTHPMTSARTRSTTTVAQPRRRASASTAASRINAVTRALKANKTIALLFYNPAAADDRAVRQELAAVPAYGSRVVKLAVPLAELAHYAVVTDQVTVNASPTLVLIDGTHRASTLVGFADRFEIAQRVTDALASR
jgi:hypothetical protein